MFNPLMKILLPVLLAFSSLASACGDNPNALVQGPFNDKNFTQGTVCFQHSSDKRDIDFYLRFSKQGEQHDIKVDTYEYVDAPAELMSVFFMQLKGSRNIVVLVRWNVNYSSEELTYPYYYEVKSYKAIKDRGYQSNYNEANDANLSGYQTVKQGQMTPFPLDDAAKIKKYLRAKYRE